MLRSREKDGYKAGLSLQTNSLNSQAIKESFSEKESEVKCLTPRHETLSQQNREPLQNPGVINIDHGNQSELQEQEVEPSGTNEKPVRPSGDNVKVEECSSKRLQEKLSEVEEGMGSLSFTEIFHLVQTGQEIPGLKKINVVPSNCDPTLSQVPRKPKPWENLS
nr:PREDICTED: uncharacterized protein C6orf226 homolog isoform X2 [Latimeria chalumnae]|eukprot:XP_014347081.1 PREDICTED: uncharacterized protein C6orf226 homolog isoform X2 [Latimeria chalumnae]